MFAVYLCKVVFSFSSCLHFSLFKHAFMIAKETQIYLLNTYNVNIQLQ